MTAIRKYGEVLAGAPLASFMPEVGEVTIIVLDKDGAFVAEEVSRQLWDDPRGREGAFAHVAYVLGEKRRWRYLET